MRKKDADAEQIRLIVLRKTDFEESSLIVSGLTEAHGKIDILFKSAKKIVKGKVKPVDIFRELKVRIRINEISKLQTVYDAELLSSFDGIANYPDNYLKAVNLSSFLTKNLHPGMESHEVYQAFKHSLEILSSEGSSLIPWTDLVKLVYIKENGLLPETDSERKLAAMLAVIDATKGIIPMPEKDADSWNRISIWIKNLCNYHGF